MNKNVFSLYLLCLDKSNMKKCGFRGGSFMGDPYDPSVSIIFVFIQKLTVAEYELKIYLHFIKI